MMTKLFAKTLVLAIGMLVAATNAYPQEAVTTDEIVQALTPKPRTRSIGSGGLSSEDLAFIEIIKKKTRGITIEERTELAVIVEKAQMPAIDLDVNFEFNSAALTADATILLQKLGTALQVKELAGTSILLAGYTDAKGAPDYNQRLSEDRSKSVLAYLMTNFQVSSDKLVAVGYGEEGLKNPADPNASENRRVRVVNLAK